MRKKLTGIISVLVIFVAGIITLRIYMTDINDKNKADEYNTSEADANVDAEADIIEEKRKAEKEELERLENDANADVTQITENGNKYELNNANDITYGGVTYNIKEVSFIPDRNMVSKLIPDYMDKRMLMAFNGNEFILDFHIKRDGERPLWYSVFSVENKGKTAIEANLANINIVMTDAEEKILDKSLEPFYVGGNDGLISTQNAYDIHLEPGESKEIVVGWDTMNTYSFTYQEYGIDDDTVLKAWIKLSPTISSGIETSPEYIDDDIDHIYIMCTEGTINELKNKYGEGE